ncbi:PglZ domain-containing protein [Leclercia adecarboxylata]|uniref:PglZ domain-containing protein n=1 Tax=Leclercia adecarboxylata TaxID=83655 RepID=UPI0025517616|nr:PglZ domain-containing protein [Leclercia adecarboxylata]
MIDTWFKEDLLRILEQHPVAVFIDESGEADFLLKSLKGDCDVYRTNGELDELETKYRIEKALQEHPESEHKYVIYTQFSKDNLTFAREYCETNGCIEIRYLQNYIKDKVHRTLNLNINLPKDELIAAAKVSVGKDRTYWMDLSHKGASEIFDLEKELLPFVHDPEAYATEKYDAQLRETFYQKVNELLGQEYIDKPASTLASEVVSAMLKGLTENNCNKTLLSVYNSWLDSMSYRNSFGPYLAKYKFDSAFIKSDAIWQINPDHPFRQVDEAWLKELGAQLADKSLAKGESAQLVARLKQRHQSKQAQALGIVFWNDIITLLDFDPKDMAYLSSFAECVDFYKKHFCPLDTAIRNLYTEFLQKRDSLEPFQELYKEYITLFLDKWFQYFGQYREDQTGILQVIIDRDIQSDGLGKSNKIAVIVGDGVAYEIAEQVAVKVKQFGSHSKLTRRHILADCPSETENNMSHIYMANRVVEAVQNKREKYLSAQNTSINLDYIRLDEVSDQALSGQVLICTYKDIDDMGDKLNHKALKYFPESIDFFAEKINLLLNIGYGKVYLITDHGFVLTGLLSEADKIEVKPSGSNYIDERFIWTSDKQESLIPQLIEVAKAYKDYSYLYFARSINPFKTPGTYGFAHGGLAPQELVTPYFCWEQESDVMGELPVTIANKHDLISVTGELYQLKLRADSGEGNMFTLDRKVMLLFFANKTQVNKSDVITVQSKGHINKEYTFDGHDELEVQLVDAITKQQLDRVLVKKNNDRDLGGLF